MLQYNQAIVQTTQHFHEHSLSPHIHDKTLIIIRAMQLLEDL